MGARILLFELLLTLCCCRHVQPSAFTRQFSQSTVELFPCDERNSTVSLYNSTMVTIMANLSHCQSTDEMTVTVSQSFISSWSIFNESISWIFTTWYLYKIVFINLTQGFRISTNIATESINSTVVFTARQLENDEFVSWNAPLSYKYVCFLWWS